MCADDGIWVALRHWMRVMSMFVLLVAVGCQTDFVVDSPTMILPSEVPANVFETLNNATDAHLELCDPGMPADPTFPDQADRITNRFCQDAKPGGVIPTPKSLKELLVLLGLDFKDPNGGNGVGGNPAFAILGHSSALTARKVSSITPTAFVFTPLLPNGKPPLDYIFLAFDPGESFLEVASFSPSDMAVNFYLVMFDKDCKKTAAGCGPNDLLTPNQVTGWSNLRIYESTTALNNTIADCRQCHIGKGHDVPDTGDPLILRMQEIEAPHTHWFSSKTPGGQALLTDFHAAHGTTEDYGPIPAGMIDKSDPALMAQFITAAGFGDQPNVFHSAAIEAEVAASAPQQPAVNVPAGTSASWQKIYDAAVAGNFIATPYHDVKVTDPQKLARMTDLYRKSMAGAPLTEDIREVFLDAAVADMGFAPSATMNGRELLAQQCQQCHNANLDPTITRDLFLVDKLDSMTRAEKDLAIERINTPLDTRLTMPPPLFRTVTPQQRALMIEELRK
jgi:mono/diheme cytochrome c family protein